MLKNLAFAVIFAYFVTNCTPRQYFDSTGNYTKLHGKEYIREGDKVYPWGQQVYRITSSKKPIKGEVFSVNPYVAKE